MFITIDRNSSISVKKQLYDGLTALILDGTLSKGDKLPSTRALARQLNIARNSVIEIYEQMVAESYFASEKGKGTFVAKSLKTEAYIKDKPRLNASEPDIIRKKVKEKENIISFYPGTPDLGHFPGKQWLNYLKDYMYGPNKKILGFSEFKGFLPLRKELVTYLRKHKGINCTEDHVFITNGTSGALNQIALTFMHDHDKMLAEKMVIDIVPNIFWCHGFQVEGLAVDEKGIITDLLPEGRRKHVIYTAPSHQMPLGGVLPVDRRRELIDYASKGGHIIIEDDYDSEFRFIGAPVNALKQIDSDCVIYLGTFSKTLGPGLRVGYMVVPDSMLELFNHVYRKSYGHVQVMDQYCLYRLLEDGQYEKHIYKMTKIYRKKSELLQKLIAEKLGDEVEIIGGTSGLHIALKYKDRKFKTGDEEVFCAVGLEVDYVTDYLFEDHEMTDETDTIILGFGHLSLKEIEEGIRRLSLI